MKKFVQPFAGVLITCGLLGAPLPGHVRPEPLRTEDREVSRRLRRTSLPPGAGGGRFVLRVDMPRIPKEWRGDDKA